MRFDSTFFEKHQKRLLQVANSLRLRWMKNRYKPKFERSKESIVFNVFRIYEQIFGRKRGIKCESHTEAYKDDDGNVVQYTRCYTLEATLCFIEARIREFFRTFKFVPIRIRIVAPHPANGGTFPIGVFFAIAFDSETLAQTITGTSLTFAHTTSGSDRLILIGGHDRSNTTTSVTGVTYATVATTKITDIRVPSDRMITAWRLVAPATGANNVVVSSSDSTNLRFSALSYSGVDQTSPIDGNNTASDAATTTGLSVSITTTSDNCWMVMFLKDNNGGVTYSSSTGDALRLNTDGGGHCVGDTNGAITPAGANAMAVTSGTTSNRAVIAISIKPVPSVVAPTVTPQNNLAMLGVS